MIKANNPVKISDVAELITSGSRGWAQYYSDNGSAFLRMGNLSRKGVKLNTSNLKYVSLPSSSTEGKRTSLQVGDILVSITAELGKIAYVRELPTREAFISQHVCLVRMKSEKINPEFVAYYMSSVETNNRLNRLNDAGAKAALNLGTISDFKLFVPPLTDQAHIAGVLRTWDEAIEKLELLLAATIKRRSWTRSNLLSGKVRLANFSEPWETVDLGQVITEHGQNKKDGDEVFSVSVHKGLVNQIEHLGRSFSAANTDHYNRVLPGDIVYTKSPTGDFPLGIIKQSQTKKTVIVSPLYGVFTPETKALGIILDSYFESPVTVKNYLHPLVQKGAKNTISITNRRFLEGKLKLPRDPAEQEAIAQYILNDRSYVEGINKEISALKRQKRGLMQKLLTGEWRVTASSQGKNSA